LLAETDIYITTCHGRYVTNILDKDLHLCKDDHNMAYTLGQDMPNTLRKQGYNVWHIKP